MIPHMSNLDERADNYAREHGAQVWPFFRRIAFGALGSVVAGAFVGSLLEDGVEEYFNWNAEGWQEVVGPSIGLTVGLTTYLLWVAFTSVRSERVSRNHAYHAGKYDKGD